MNSFEFLNKDVSILKGIGNKTSSILKKKNINKISDILWDFPRSTVDNITNCKINELQIGKKHTINIIPKKYSFPRIRNLPFKVICEDETGKIDCVFFNSYEKYIRKILPINISVNITGIVNFYKKKYQIINPKVTSLNHNQTTIIDSKYSLTEGLKQTNYNRIINHVLTKLPDLDEWLNEEVLKKFNNVSWKESILKIHKEPNIISYNSDYYRRLAYDEILATFLISSQVRKKINVDTDIGLFIESLFFLPLALLIYYLIFKNNLIDFSLSNPSLMFLLFLAGPMTLIPLFLYIKGVELSGLGPSGMIFFITPTAQFLLGFFYYNELFSTEKFIGFILIWIAVFIYLKDLYENN